MYESRVAIVLTSLFQPATFIVSFTFSISRFVGSDQLEAPSVTAPAAPQAGCGGGVPGSRHF